MQVIIFFLRGFFFSFSKNYETRNLIKTTIRNFGRIDRLILNSAITSYGYFDKSADLAIYRQLMDVNFFGYLYCTYYALPHLKKTKGIIGVMSSLSGNKIEMNL